MKIAGGTTITVCGGDVGINSLLTVEGNKNAYLKFLKPTSNPACTLDQNNMPAGSGLRVGVKGGGCSGLSYVMEFAYGANPDDQVVDLGNVRFFVDPKSSVYLEGTELDYVEGLMGSGFEFKNPNVQRSCACGESFSV